MNHFFGSFFREAAACVQDVSTLVASSPADFSKMP